MQARSCLSALILSLGVLAAPVMADPAVDAKKAAEQAAADAAAQAEKAAKMAADQAAAAKAAATMTEQPAANPSAIPVPDGPVVNKQELEGGLLAEDLVIGTGYEVKPGNAVVALYHGTLKADPSKVFDSAFTRGEPVAFALSGVIPGWQKGVPGMKVGGVRRLTIPAALAYGANSPSPDIPANSDLVFVIKLVDAVQIEDTKVGEGEAATDRCVAVCKQTIKDSEGKELASDPMYIWVPGEPPMMVSLDGRSIICSFDGMKVGGKRTIKFPKEFNPETPGLDTKRPSKIPLTMEVELLAVRNLGQR